MNIDNIKRLCPEFTWVLNAYPEITKNNAVLIVEALAEARQALEWRDIADAPKDGTVLRVLLKDGINSHEYYSFYQERECTCMNSWPRHSPHLHREWLICDGFGEELHPTEVYKVIHPTHFRYIPTPPSLKEG